VRIGGDHLGGRAGTRREDAPLEYSDGEVRQQFSVCFACRVVGGELATSKESLEVGFLPAY